MKEIIIYDSWGNPHEPGCPAIADDESDYEYLWDAGQCVCKYRESNGDPVVVANERSIDENQDCT